MATYLKCPRCEAALPAQDVPAGRDVICPTCGHPFRRKNRTDPASAGAREAFPAAKAKPRRRKGKKAQARKRGRKLPLVIGGGVAGLVLVVILIVVLASGGGGKGQAAGDNGNLPGPAEALGAGAVVFDEPLPLPPAPQTAPPGVPAPPAPQPRRTLTAALDLLPEASPEDTLAGASSLPWQGKPDPAPAAPPALPAKAFLYLQNTEAPLLAARGGPFALEHKGDRSQRLDRDILGDDNELSPYSPLQVRDLRTGKVAGRFAWKVPALWKPRLSPDAQYLIAPDHKPGSPATTRNGLLFVWQREKAHPAGTLKVPGTVRWLDFVANDRVGVLTFADTPVLQVWDVANLRLEKTVALPREEFPTPTRDPNTGQQLARGMKAYATDPLLGAVSPGGRYLALGGATAVHVLSLTDGKRVGALPVPRHRLWQSGKPGDMHYQGLAFSDDGGELHALLQTERGWLLTWSLATGRTSSLTGLNPRDCGGPLLAGPEPHTVILPFWKFDDRFVMNELKTANGLPVHTGAVLDVRTGAVLTPLTDLALRRNGDGILALSRRQFHPDLPLPESYANRPLNQYDRQHLPNVHAVLVTALDRGALRKELASQPAGAWRPPARAGDRAGLVAARPTPPAAWTRPPAPPAPVRGLVGAEHVPNSAALFGDAHVGFVSGYARLNDPKLIESLRIPAQTGNQQAREKLDAAYQHPAGVHWYRYDLRTGKPLGPAVPLWPWATSPFPGKTLDFGRVPVAAAMTRDGNRLALRDPADAARVDVWDASGARLLGLIPYDPGTPIQWVGWSAGGRLLTLGGGKLTGWDVPSGRAVFEVDGGYRLPVAPARGGAWLAVRAGTHFDILDAEAGRCLGRCTPAEGEFDPSGLMDLALAPDGTLLACLAHRKKPDAAGPGVVLAWDLTTGKALPPVAVKRLPGRAMVALDRRRVLLDGLALVDLPAGLEYADYLTPPFRSFWDMPHTGGPLPGSPDGRLWSFGPEAGMEDPGKQRSPNRVMLRPLDLPGYDPSPAHVFRKETPLVVVVDLGTRERSQKFGKNLVAFLQGEGQRIGRGGWKLRATCEVQASDHFLTFKNGGGEINVPRVVISWTLFAPDGEAAFTKREKSEFGPRSKYFQGSRVVGRKGMVTQVEMTWNFRERDPHEAMVEELLDAAARGGAVRLPPVLGKFQGKYQPLPARTSAAFPPLAGRGG